MSKPAIVLLLLVLYGCAGNSARKSTAIHTGEIKKAALVYGMYTVPGAPFWKRGIANVFKGSETAGDSGVNNYLDGLFADYLGYFGATYENAARRAGQFGIDTSRIHSFIAGKLEELESNGKAMCAYDLKTGECGELTRLCDSLSLRYLLACRYRLDKTSSGNILSGGMAYRYMELAVIDAQEKKFIWHCLKRTGGAGDTLLCAALLRSLVYNLFTGNDVSPAVFITYPRTLPVRVTLHTGNAREGYLKEFDRFDVVLREGKTVEERIPLATIRSIYQISGRETVYPR